MGATTFWFMGSLTYTDEVMREVCASIKITNLLREKLPISHGDYIKLDSSLLLDEEQQPPYHKLVVTVERMV